MSLCIGRHCLLSASPRPNFPAEDKSHNLCVNVVDPIRKRLLLGTLWICNCDRSNASDFVVLTVWKSSSHHHQQAKYCYSSKITHSALTIESAFYYCIVEIFTGYESSKTN